MKKGKIFIGIAGIGAIITGGISALKLSNNRIKKISDKAQRTDAYYKIANQWLNNMQAGKKAETYFLDNNIQSIAIYGMGSLAEILSKELQNTDIVIKYYIDKCADEMICEEDNCDIINIDKIPYQEAVDAIIVTPIHVYESIEEELKNVYSGKIISLNEVIYEV